MPDGFFSTSELTTTRTQLPLIAQCGICQLYKGCQSPKMSVKGKGRKGILVVGEAPGETEDKQGRPFVGKTGQILQDTLRKYGVDLFRDCWVINSARCFVSPKVLIYTSEGYKWLGKVQVGDLVLTHKGRFRKVLSRLHDLPLEQRRNTEPLVDICYGRNKLTVTHSHQFLTKAGWKNAGDIWAGELVRVMAECCAICGKAYFKNPQGFDAMGSFCSRKCQNVYVGSISGPALSKSLKEQYADGRRDVYKTTEAAHKKVKELVAKGGWNPVANMSSESLERGRINRAKASERRNDIKEDCPILGYGEKEVARYLKWRKIDFYSQYAIGGNNFDFLLTDYNLLVEIENPTTFKYNKGMKLLRYPKREKIAKDNGFKLVFLTSDDPVAEIKRLLRNDDHEYSFVWEPVKSISIHLPNPIYQKGLFCLEVEEDHSFVSKGVVSHNCHPYKNKLPPKSIEYCRPYVVQDIRELKPEKIILVGAYAVKSVIGWLWKEDPGGIGRWIGWRIPNQRLNAWITPIWHPSFVIREEEAKKGVTPVRMLWERHIEAVCKLQGRPWEEVPDYDSQVQTFMDPSKAAEAIRVMLAGNDNRPMAFDYETDTLKPDSKDACIVTCSLSDGKKSIAYPWHGEAAKETRKFLLSDIPKWGANNKYEARYSLAKDGIWIKNWDWDVVLAAHILDNRSDISSLKFQAFVQLGQESYDDLIKPYFKTSNSNEKNRIRELPLSKVLHYNALDSLLTWKVAEVQRKQAGIDV